MGGRTARQPGVLCSVCAVLRPAARSAVNADGSLPAVLFLKFPRPNLPEIGDAESITALITDALPRVTEGSATRVPPSPPALIDVQRLDLLVSGKSPVDQRCQLRIMVVGLVSVPEATTDRRSPP